jgi:hypothetical protein
VTDGFAATARDGQQQ